MALGLVSSLLLTVTICFVLPAASLGLAFGALSIGMASPIAAVSEAGRQLLVAVLSTFGSGSVFQGGIIICLTISAMAGLFDVFAFYRDLSLKSHEL